MFEQVRDLLHSTNEMFQACWFGENWGADICYSQERVETPVGAPCIHCEEKIEANDSGYIYANGPVAHRNCFMRQITGSVAHIEGRCSCYVAGATCTDPPGMTKRQAADAAVALYRKLNP